MPIDWNASLETGLDVIDEQHKRIIDYINRLDSARTTGDRRRVAEVLDELIDYTQSHFVFEESLMEEAGYAFLKAHRKVHEIFVKRVDAYIARLDRGEDITQELQKTLTRWLLNHIRNEDRDYVEAVKRLAELKQPTQPQPQAEAEPERYRWTLR